MTDNEQMVEDCQNRESMLSDWERGFIDSLAKQMADGRSLTEKQADKLESIWTKIT